LVLELTKMSWIPGWLVLPTSYGEWGRGKTLRRPNGPHPKIEDGSSAKRRFGRKIA